MKLLLNTDSFFIDHDHKAFMAKFSELDIETAGTRNLMPNSVIELESSDTGEKRLFVFKNVNWSDNNLVYAWIYMQATEISCRNHKLTHDPNLTEWELIVLNK